MRINNLLLFVLSFFFLSGNSISQAQTGVSLSAKVFLQGPLIDVPVGENLMRDDLRAACLLPISEPYKHTGPGGTAATVKPAIFMNTGPDAIVDWLSLELRQADNPCEVLATRSALLQRDGDVVGLDGHSAVYFEGMEAGGYFIAMRHRNHLPIMTAEAIWLSDTPLFIDFSNPDLPVCSANAQLEIDGVLAMWAGDVNGDGRIIFQGPGTDVFMILFQIISHPDNVDNSANFIHSAYSNADIDLDGKVIHEGPGSDTGKIFGYVVAAMQQLFSAGQWQKGLFFQC